MFTNLDDTLSLEAGFAKCGLKTYELVSEFNFAALKKLSDTEYELSINSVFEEDLGSHILIVLVSMDEYERFVTPLKVQLNVTISRNFNEPPYFEPSLADDASLWQIDRS